MKKVGLPLKYVHLIHKVIYVVVFLLMVACWIVSVRHIITRCTPEIATIEKEKVEIVETQMLTDSDFSKLYTCKESYRNDTTIQLTKTEAQLLMKLAMSEAGDMGIDAQLLVMNVIVNRLNNDLFPDNITDIIYQDDPLQFAVTQNGALDKAEPNSDSHVALAYLEMGKDISQGALYFESSSNSSESWHSQNKEFLYEKYGQRFYK